MVIKYRESSSLSRGTINVMVKVSCIIAAYNEGKRIGEVLNVVSLHPLIDEVIVINDGSTDETSSIIHQFKNIILINQPRKLGKSRALSKGLQKARGTYLLFLDADLIGLNKHNITDLISPVIKRQVPLTISLRKNTLWPWKIIGLDYLSGDRMLPASILKNQLDSLASLDGFGVEVFFNKLIINNFNSLQIVNWKNVSSPYKYKKYGFWKGCREDLRMIEDILKLATPIELILQIIKLSRLKVKAARSDKFSGNKEISPEGHRLNTAENHNKFSS